MHRVPVSAITEARTRTGLSQQQFAKVLGVSPTTRLGLVKGTPGCMAPEQAHGETIVVESDDHVRRPFSRFVPGGGAPVLKLSKLTVSASARGVNNAIASVVAKVIRRPS